MVDSKHAKISREKYVLTPLDYTPNYRPAVEGGTL